MAGENRGPQVEAVAATFLALSTTAVLLRCYCRIVVVKAFGIDDYLSVVAQLFYMFFCGFAITGVHYGTGRHAVDIIPASNIPIGLKWWWACEPVYVLGVCCLKFSVGIFLLRLAVTRLQRWILCLTMGISGVMSIMYFFVFVFQCYTPSYFWVQYMDPNAKGSCLNTDIIINSTYAYSAMSCLSDFTFCILPAFMVWRLNMNIRTKISVIILLGLSAIASAATIARFPYIGALANKSDFLWATTDVAIWSLSEQGLGITASAMATLRPLFRTFLSRSRLFGDTTEGDAVASANPWPKSKNPGRAGYLKSGQGNNKDQGSRGSVQEEIVLRNDIPKQTGVTTTVSGDDTFDLEAGGYGNQRQKSVTQGTLREWNEQDDKLADDSSDTSERYGGWGRKGIRMTTTVSTNNL